MRMGAWLLPGYLGVSSGVLTAIGSEGRPELKPTPETTINLGLNTVNVGLNTEQLSSASAVQQSYPVSPQAYESAWSACSSSKNQQRHGQNARHAAAC